MEENLKAIVPHQFGGHSLCNARFCGYKRKPGSSYTHRSLPYKTSLQDSNLRQKLQQLFDPIIYNAGHYIDLGSSQQCEHANKEVTLRAPKSHHYGNSSSLDYRVHATAAFINEGRHYISKGYSMLGLSPGTHTVRHAEKCMKQREKKREKAKSPSTKLRRLLLKQERATNQGANEALEGDTYQSGKFICRTL
ncbi:uncharacterized protein LOC132748331 [Ruditapes philippinarum]|uniref:uncharacterized protein LOC132748331 n=1 Tax=Ruditapes philippinarum TaxID=129788 RepID=UPI00295BB27F|nr:uncharacterized protein LOC132748331 [Ruditapes philippinarum]